MTNYLASAYAAAANKAIEDAKDMMGSRLERSVEMSALREDLCMAGNVLAEMTGLIGALENAADSLRACGYSEEWLNTINLDGSFLPAIGVNKLDLVGSDDAKFEATMEGIMNTIWDWVKKIWNWIINAFVKFVAFIKGIISSLRDSEAIHQKAINLIGTVATGLTPDLIRTIGEAIDESGINGKYYRIQPLADRVGVEAAISKWICDNAFGIIGANVLMMENTLAALNDPKVKGKTTLLKILNDLKMTFPDGGIWSSYVDKYKQSPELSQGNLIFKVLAEVIRNTPAALPEVYTIRNGKAVTFPSSEICAIMKSVGIKLEEFAPQNKNGVATYSFSKEPLSSSVETTSYASDLKNVGDVMSLLEGQKLFIEKMGKIQTEITNGTTALRVKSAFMTRFVDSCKMALGQMAAAGATSDEQLEMSRIICIVQETSRHIAETVNLLVSFGVDAGSALAAGSKIAEVVIRVAPQFAGKKA